MRVPYFKKNHSSWFQSTSFLPLLLIKRNVFSKDKSEIRLINVFAYSGLISTHLSCLYASRCSCVSAAPLNASIYFLVMTVWMCGCMKMSLELFSIFTCMFSSMSRIYDRVTVGCKLSVFTATGAKRCWHCSHWLTYSRGILFRLPSPDTDMMHTHSATQQDS